MKLLLGLVIVAAIGCRDRTAIDTTPSSTVPPSDPVTAPVEALGRVEVPVSATGRLVVVPGQAPAPPDVAKVWKYTVEVEDGLPFDTGEFADFVQQTLNDSRGWGHGGTLGFARTDSRATADFYLTLASPTLTDAYCAASGLNTVGHLSCFAASSERPMLNALRWGQGLDAYGDDLVSYREYMINHEVGHWLGHGHVLCPGTGQLAPPMMQQSKNLSGCRPNPWPYPDGDTLITGPSA